MFWGFLSQRLNRELAKCIVFQMVLHGFYFSQTTAAQQSSNQDRIKNVIILASKTDENGTENTFTVELTGKRKMPCQLTFSPKAVSNQNDIAVTRLKFEHNLYMLFGLPHEIYMLPYHNCIIPFISGCCI